MNSLHTCRICWCVFSLGMPKTRGSRKRPKVSVPELPESVSVSFWNTRCTLERDEMNRLSPGQFLSEDILDFFICKRASERTDQLSIDVVSTRFYQKLTCPRKLPPASNVPPLVNEALQRVGYLEVQHLHPRIFSSSFVFVPVHVDNNHWILAVIYLRNVPLNDRQGAIIIFDSLKRDEADDLYSTVSSNLRDFLNCHWCLQVQLGNLNPSRVFTVETCPMIVADIPEQKNGSDCGLYVLKACEVVMNNANVIADHCLVEESYMDWLRKYFADQFIFDSVSYRDDLLNELRK